MYSGFVSEKLVQCWLYMTESQKLPDHEKFFVELTNKIVVTTVNPQNNLNFKKQFLLFLVIITLDS